MCAMPDDCGYTFQHPVGHESRYYRACLIGRVGGQTELVHPPSSFQALTAAAAPGFLRNCDLTPWRFFKGCQSELSRGYSRSRVGR